MFQAVFNHLAKCQAPFFLPTGVLLRLSQNQFRKIFSNILLNLLLVNIPLLVEQATMFIYLLTSGILFFF